MAQMMISNLIRLTMNCTNLSKYTMYILICCGKGCHANLPHLDPKS